MTMTVDSVSQLLVERTVEGESGKWGAGVAVIDMKKVLPSPAIPELCICNK